MSPKKPDVPPTMFQIFVRKYLFLTVVVLIILVGVVTYLLGYRIGPALSVQRVGTLELPNLPTGATIYVDQVIQGTITATSTKNISLMRGDHPVIVSVTGDYPWNNLVSITSGQTTVLNPILIPEEPDATPLTGTSATAALAAVASTTLPTQSAPLILANGCAHVYVSNNQVVADPATAMGCTPPPYLCVNGKCASTIIFAPVDSLSAVLPYPGRQDALLVGLNDTLYAIALDPRAPQFFAPVLGATSPSFGLLPNGTLVVKNGTSIFSIKL